MDQSFPPRLGLATALCFLGREVILDDLSYHFLDILLSQALLLSFLDDRDCTGCDLREVVKQLFIEQVSCFIRQLDVRVLLLKDVPHFEDLMRGCRGTILRRICDYLIDSFLGWRPFGW